MIDLLEYVRDNWEPLALAVSLIVALIAYLKTRATWKSRNFMSRVNLSLNYVEDNKLKIRTLREDDIGRILLGNKHGKRLLLRAARKTTVGEPFLSLPQPDAWVVLNAILNELSEQFADGFLARSMGLSTRSATYVFGVTCEKDRDVRINKIRVMIIKRSLLERIDDLEEVEFESPLHHIRLETLRLMKRIFLDKDRGHLLRSMELVVDGDAQ